MTNLEKDSFDWTKANPHKKRKEKAKELFRVNINIGTTTWASLERRDSVYGANVNEDYLCEDWYLILNDHILKKLRLFKIPATTKLGKSKLYFRNDKPNRFVVQIRYNDDSFTEIHSQISFSEFLIKEVDY